MVDEKVVGQGDGGPGKWNAGSREGGRGMPIVFSPPNAAPLPTSFAGGTRPVARLII